MAASTATAAATTLRLPTPPERLLRELPPPIDPLPPPPLPGPPRAASPRPGERSQALVADSAAPPAATALADDPARSAVTAPVDTLGAAAATAPVEPSVGPAVEPAPADPDRDAEPEAGPPTFAARAAKAAREGATLIGVALLMAFVIKTLFVQAFYIPSGSMLDTLQLQDRVMVEKVTYLYRLPERGEVIVFRRPGLEDEGFSPSRTARSFLEGLGLAEPDADRDLIKRVIGLPGETVEMIDGIVHINGQPLEEDYTLEESRDFPAVVVPEGHYYVLGDNRGNSLDSRFALGTIPEENIIGRAFMILWPPGNVTLSLDTDYPVVGEQALPPLLTPPSTEPASPLPGRTPPPADGS